MKLLPAVITLLAGACTSIITYLLHYEVSKSLWILLIVLVLFYIMGSIAQKVIFGFEKQIELEEQERAEAEGKVVEKDIPEGADAKASAGEQGEDASQDYESEAEDDSVTNTEAQLYGDEYSDTEEYKDETEG
jgi:flagellar basal body-associated protein FliL